ncbi:hypothetical protein [Arenibacterium halophilum]|uniref:Uncharacterized protein n=1 Tax=Arenibacterium halophilum TaxID=2583821 RepID=A0ABY2XD78_9RHOB|nr:hypothetical protein [Arenibacterium halophilum]TMV14924.1 hypothetical protein FGK64_02800 [Arenibacterium halophilum]
MFDADGKYSDPARTIDKRGLQKKVNRQTSGKACGIVDTESELESIILIAADLDPRVRGVFPQPCTFDLNTGEAYPSKQALMDALHGTRYRPWCYTPDFLLQLVDGSKVFIEGKHTRFLEGHPTFSAVPIAMADYGHRQALCDLAPCQAARRRQTHRFQPKLRRRPVSVSRRTPHGSSVGAFHFFEASPGSACSDHDGHRGL